MPIKMILSFRMKVGLAFLAEWWFVSMSTGTTVIFWCYNMKVPNLAPLQDIHTDLGLKSVSFWRQIEATGERGGVKSAVGSAEINVLWNKSIGCDLWCHLHRPTSCIQSHTAQTRAHKAETGHCTVTWLPIKEAIATGLCNWHLNFGHTNTSISCKQLWLFQSYKTPKGGLIRVNDQ